MTAEEAMDRIGNVIESVYAGELSASAALNYVAQTRGAYLSEAAK
jgi:hypothetical protein